MNLPLLELTFLIFLFFVTSVVGVVTGSNSLITVPVMFQFGIDPRVAVATNMFGLTFMSIGASLPFLKQGAIDTKRLPIFAVLTVIGSALGAFLVGMISSKAMPLIVSVAMIAIAIFIFFNRNAETGKKHAVSGTVITVGFILTFLLAIYGGFYSGGYITMLTAVFASMMGMTFAEAVANTKIINVFSSLVATLVFAWQGLIDYKLGIILGITMFVAAYAGAHFVTKLSDFWLKRIFLIVVFALAIKTIIDFTIR